MSPQLRLVSQQLTSQQYEMSSRVRKPSQLPPPDTTPFQTSGSPAPSNPSTGIDSAPNPARATANLSHCNLPTPPSPKTAPGYPAQGREFGPRGRFASNAFCESERQGQGGRMCLLAAYVVCGSLCGHRAYLSERALGRGKGEGAGAGAPRVMSERCGGARPLRCGVRFWCGFRLGGASGRVVLRRHYLGVM